MLHIKGLFKNESARSEIPKCSDTSLEKSEGSLAFTGERMIPIEATPAIFWEHIYRYRFACQFVPGRVVLDIACGEGYGSKALLDAGASRVIGVDIAEDACAYACKTYGLDTVCASAEMIPIPESSIDVVVSFETLEHLNEPSDFLDECRRILRPGGQIILSTPNKKVYSEKGSHNPFHTCEYDKNELQAVVVSRFSKYELYFQRPKAAPLLSSYSLTAADSRLLRYRGFRHLRRLLKKRTAKHLWEPEVSMAVRSSPVQTILQKDKLLSTLVNPYSVRRVSKSFDEKAKYFVIVASK